MTSALQQKTRVLLEHETKSFRELGIMTAIGAEGVNIDYLAAECCTRFVKNECIVFEDNYTYTYELGKHGICLAPTYEKKSQGNMKFHHAWIRLYELENKSDPLMSEIITKEYLLDMFKQGFMKYLIQLFITPPDD